nr:EexN family lipoprotein [Campylobacter sp.]
VAIIGAGVGAGGTWAVVKCDNEKVGVKQEELAKTISYYRKNKDIAKKVVAECKTMDTMTEQQKENCSNALAALHL